MDCDNLVDVYKALNIRDLQILQENLDVYNVVVGDLESARKLFDEYIFETNVDEDSLEALREFFGVIKEEYESLEAEEEEDEDVYAVIQELVNEVEEALKGDCEFDSDEDLVELLRTYIRVLLDEYESASAED